MNKSIERRLLKLTNQVKDFLPTTLQFDLRGEECFSVRGFAPYDRNRQKYLENKHVVFIFGDNVTKAKLPDGTEFSYRPRRS